jgi:hypothetical protein
MLSDPEVDLDAGREATQRAKGEKLMPNAVATAVLITIMAIAPAYGAPKECTDAHMKQMDAMIAKMTYRTKKKEAAAALKMSKAEMKKGNMEGCMKYMIDATPRCSMPAQNLTDGRRHPELFTVLLPGAMSALGQKPTCGLFIEMSA